MFDTLACTEGGEYLGQQLFLTDALRSKLKKKKKKLTTTLLITDFKIDRKLLEC